MTISKRFISLLLALLLGLSLLTAAGLADEEPAPEDAAAPEEAAILPEEALPEEAPEEEALPEEAPAAGSGEEAEEGPFEVPAAASAGFSEGESDNDALFAAYAETCFYGAPLTEEPAPALDGVSRGDRLTGLEKALYTVLRGYIQEVAAGTRTNTAFEISPEQLLGSRYKPSDLEAITALVGDNAATGRVINSLLADLPYDLYWYDKTAGYSTNTCGYQYWTSGGYISKLVLPDGYFMKFSMKCAGSYSTSLYQAKTYGSSVRTAVSKAGSIVSKYAGKSDYEKLLGYKDEICALAAFNWNAENGGVAFGDPWQLIYVFDGNESTKVICEGYSKAFKYLCDLTSFDCPLIECFLVSGVMTENGVRKNHMWDLVRMGDGKNYLVDVTNSDAGMIGNPDKLFLMGYQSGSVSNGYTVPCGLKYEYGSGIKSLFTTQELTLAAQKYDKNFVYKPDPIPGDGDRNGKLHAFDGALVLQFCVGRLPKNAVFDSALANMNGDSETNPADAALILRSAGSGS